MSTTTSEAQKELEPNQKMKVVSRDIGCAIADIESAQYKMNEWRQDLENIILVNHSNVQNQLDEIKNTVDDLRDLVTETGVARWRIAAENALSLGERHISKLETVSQEQLKSLETQNETFKRLLKKSLDRLDKASVYTTTNIADALKAFRINDIKRLAEQSTEMVQEASLSAINRFKNAFDWLHWKNLGVVLAVTIVISAVMGIYINDASPWEKRQQVVMQRNAGKALLNAWPQLSQIERERIVGTSDSAVG